MVDQTQNEILEVQTKNKQIKYEADTTKMFDEWLEKCPVKFYLNESLDDNFIKVQYTFTKTERIE